MVELTRSYEGSGRLLYLDCQLTEDNHKEGKETLGRPAQKKSKFDFFVILVLRITEQNLDSYFLGCFCTGSFLKLIKDKDWFNDS